MIPKIVRRSSLVERRKAAIRRILRKGAMNTSDMLNYAPRVFSSLTSLSEVLSKMTMDGEVSKYNPDGAGLGGRSSFLYSLNERADYFVPNLSVKPPQMAGIMEIQQQRRPV